MGGGRKRKEKCGGRQKKLDMTKGRLKQNIKRMKTKREREKEKEEDGYKKIPYEKVQKTVKNFEIQNFNKINTDTKIVKKTVFLHIILSSLPYK